MAREDGQFKAGNSANPGGRAKRTAELAIKISEMDEKYRARLDYIADFGTPKESVLAIKLLWGYAHGNPAQAVTGPDGEPLFPSFNFGALSPEQLQQLEQIRQALKKP